MGADVTSDPISIESFTCYAMQFVWTGTPAGNITIEHSIDGTTFSTVANTTTAAGGAAGNVLLNIEISAARFVRAKYVRSSSTGTLNGYFLAKE